MFAVVLLYLSSVVSCRLACMYYRYVILGWQSGSSRLPPRHLLDADVEQLLTWHQKCSKILMCLELPNMMFMALASSCGNFCLDSCLLKMVR